MSDQPRSIRGPGVTFSFPFLATVLVSLTALVASACSVATPRHGAVSASQEGAGTEAAFTSGDPVEDADIGETRLPSSGRSSAPGSAARQPQTAGQPDDAGTAAPETPGGGEGPADPAEPLEPTGSSVGVTKTAITMSVSMPFSGPLGVIWQRIYDSSFVVWAREVHDRGGIHGRDVILKKIDNKGTADGAISACKEAQSNGSFMVVLAYGLDSEADCLDRAGIPVLFAFAGRIDNDWQNVRVIAYEPNVVPPLISFIRGPLDAANDPIGVVYVYDNQPMAATAQAFDRAAKAAGLALVEPERIATNQAAFVAEASRLRDRGAKTVVLFTGLEAMGFVRDSRRIGYEPLFTGGASFPGDTSAQAARSDFDGIRALRFQATIDSPAYADFEKKADRYGAPSKSGTDMAAYGWARVAEELLVVAGTEPTRTTVIQGSNGIRDHFNGIWPPITWSAKRIVGATAAFPVICCTENYNWRSFGPPAERFE